MSLNSVLVGFFGKPVLALVRLRITTLEGALSQRGPGSSYDPEEDRGAWLQPGGEQRLQPGGEQRLQPGRGPGSRGYNPEGEQRLQPEGEQRLQPRGEQRLQPGRGPGSRGYNPEGEQRLQPEGEQRLQPRGEQRLQPGGEQRLQPGDRGAGYNPEGGGWRTILMSPSG
jgi:hypothetical protein